MREMDGEPVVETRGKHRRKLLRRLLIAAGVASVLCVVVVVGFSLIITRYWGNGNCLGAGPPYARTTIERRAMLTLPPSARQIEADSTGFQECNIYLRFQMASEDLESFLASTLVAELTPRSGSDLELFQVQTHPVSPDVHWQLDEEMTYVYGTGEDGPQASQHILVDTADPETFTVYVITFLM